MPTPVEPAPHEFEHIEAAFVSLIPDLDHLKDVLERPVTSGHDALQTHAALVDLVAKIAGTLAVEKNTR
jgi:hypothetical protein